ncbi:MAG: hypothetical protein M0R66_07315 [Candidatus Omnitrophica bacterium]|jgi:hypothetical protein|nr:hypothetical protein [Candidatus Omnitrophota bacterium]
MSTVLDGVEIVEAVARLEEGVFRGSITSDEVDPGDSLPHFWTVLVDTWEESLEPAGALLEAAGSGEAMWRLGLAREASPGAPGGDLSRRCSEIEGAASSIPGTCRGEKGFIGSHTRLDLEIRTSDNGVDWSDWRRLGPKDSAWGGFFQARALLSRWSPLFQRKVGRFKIIMVGEGM